MLNQTDVFNLEYMLTPVISFMILLILMIVMVFLFTRKKVWLPILIVFLFSLVIGINSLGTPNFPFSPYFQIFFIVFQTVFFLLTSKDVYYH